MPAGVVLDTSFLITLADPAEAHHATARRYWRLFTEAGVPLLLPTVVAAEFSVRQPIPPAILHACVVLPFNWDDAIKAAALAAIRVEREGASRDALKDDLKIIAQAIVKDAAYLITGDQKMFYKIARQLSEAGQAPFRVIKLDDGFDPSCLDPQGQREFGGLTESDETESTS